jgi:hypothetical protein
VNIEYALDDKLDSISSDNGANFVKAVKELVVAGVAEESMRCSCHTLQLSIKNSIEVV